MLSSLIGKERHAELQLTSIMLECAVFKHCSLGGD